MADQFRDFLALSYAELEDLNLGAKEQRKARADPVMGQRHVRAN